MTDRKNFRLAALFLAGLLLLGGCSGVLYEKQDDAGRVDRVRLDGGESWNTFDTTPRYRSNKAKDQDPYCIMLKSEATF
jgi:hypothetical protein